MRPKNRRHCFQLFFQSLEKDAWMFVSIFPILEARNKSLCHTELSLCSNGYRKHQTVPMPTAHLKIGRRPPALSNFVQFPNAAINTNTWDLRQTKTTSFSVPFDAWFKKNPTILFYAIYTQQVMHYSLTKLWPTSRRESVSQLNKLALYCSAQFLPSLLRVWRMLFCWRVINSSCKMRLSPRSSWLGPEG